MAADVQKKKWYTGLGHKLSSLVALFILFASMAIFIQLSMPVRAVASFDSECSIQMKLDKNCRVMQAVSLDDSVPAETLRTLEGRPLTELGTVLSDLLGDEVYLISYAPRRGKATPGVEELMRGLFPWKDVVYIDGVSRDISAAGRTSLSLGRYLAGVQASEREWERMDHLETEQMAALLKLLEEDTNWTKVSAFRKALESKQAELGVLSE